MRCSECSAERPEDEFVTAKGRPTDKCRACRRAFVKRRIQERYRTMSKDERHRLAHKARAKAYGVEHVPYVYSEVFARWDHRCIYCSAPASHLDHIAPLSRGGTDTESNVAPACQDCNLSKGSKSLAEWAATFVADPLPF